MSRCPSCDRGRADPVLCRSCADRTRTHVAALPALQRRLSERLQPTGKGGPKVTITSGDETGINLDPRVVRLRIAIPAIMSEWCRIISEDRDIHTPKPTLPRLGAFLLLHHEWLMTQRFADEYAASIDDAWSEAQRLIVPPKSRRFGGACRRTMPDGTACVGEVLVDPEADTAQCFSCGYEATVTDHWAELFGVVADDWLGTATEISQLIALRDGTWLPPSTIRNWASRKRLISRGQKGNDPMYRLDSVLELQGQLRRDRNGSDQPA